MNMTITVLIKPVVSGFARFRVVADARTFPDSYAPVGDRWEDFLRYFGVAPEKIGPAAASLRKGEEITLSGGLSAELLNEFEKR